MILICLCPFTWNQNAVIQNVKCIAVCQKLLQLFEVVTVKNTFVSRNGMTKINFCYIGVL